MNLEDNGMTFEDDEMGFVDIEMELENAEMTPEVRNKLVAIGSIGMVLSCIIIMVLGSSVNKYLARRNSSGGDLSQIAIVGPATLTPRPTYTPTKPFYTPTIMPTVDMTATIAVVLTEVAQANATVPATDAGTETAAATATPPAAATATLGTGENAPLTATVAALLTEAAIPPSPTISPTATITSIVTITSTPTSPPTAIPVDFIVPFPAAAHMTCVSANAQRDLAQVVRVVDGDIIEVIVNGTLRLVRYIGIDAPAPADYYGFQATTANSLLVGGQVVTLIKDQSDTDQYGHLLRYVFTSTTFVNSALLADGSARAFIHTADLSCVGDFLDVQQIAQDDGLGIWAAHTVTPSPSTATPTQTPTPASFYTATPTPTP